MILLSGVIWGVTSSFNTASLNPVVVPPLGAVSENPISLPDLMIASCLSLVITLGCDTISA